MFTLAWRKVGRAFGYGVAFKVGGVMQQPTSRQLYAYWDRVRNGRIAPRRFEIEPAKSAALLPETFIAEGVGPLGHRFRLAGTRICEQFGRELRGADLLSLWEDADRDAVAALLRTVFADAAVGYGRFKAYRPQLRLGQRPAPLTALREMIAGATCARLGVETRFVPGFAKILDNARTFRFE